MKIILNIDKWGHFFHMQNRPYANQTVSSTTKSANTKPAVQQDQLVRIFNTALASTQAGKKRDFSSELCELTESSSFKSILNAVRQLAHVQGVSEREAAEEVIRTFRRMDELWGEYIFREGLDKLRNSKK